MGTVGVEEKEVGELVTAAMSTGRLDEQLSKCVDTYEVPILMTLGTYDEKYGALVDRHTRFRPVKIDFDRLDNLLVEWQLRGLFVKSCPDPGSRVYRLASLYNFTTKPEHRAFFMRRRKMPNLKKLSARAELLTTLPTIGIKRAASLAALPYTLHEILNWSENEWTAWTGTRAGAKRIMALLAQEPTA
jgi:ERCC4-type nuclease